MPKYSVKKNNYEVTPEQSILKVENSKKLKLTKQRLQKLWESSQDEHDDEAEKIVEKIRKYIKHEDRMKSLSPSMRNKVLQEMSRAKYRKVYEENSEEFEKYMKVFPLLLSEKTKEVELIGTPSVYPLDTRNFYLTKRFEHLALNARNLQILAVSGVQTDETMDESVKAMLGKMDNLEKLQIQSYRIKYTHLKELCKKLPKLQYVDVWIDFDCQTRFDDVDGFVDSFSRLRFFLFNSKGFFAADCEDTLTRMCIQHLPRLQVVRKFADNNVYHLDENLELPNNPTDLRHLCARPSLRILHETFPKVTHLRVNFFNFVGSLEVEKIEIRPLLLFENIESLFLDNVPAMEVVEQFLEEYGPNLLELRIHACDKSELVINPGAIAVLCPRLRKLSLFKVIIEEQGTRPKKVVQEQDKPKPSVLVDEQEPKKVSPKLRAYALPNDSFLQLRELAFEPDESSNGALLSSVLCAPKLERFMLSLRRVENIDVEDLERISVWIEEQQILTNLTHFQLASHPTVLNAEFCRAFSDFTRNASAFLPKLARFDAMFRLSCVDVRHFMAEGEEDVVCTDRDRQLTAEKFAEFGEHKYVQFLNAYKRN